MALAQRLTCSSVLHYHSVRNKRSEPSAVIGNPTSSKNEVTEMITQIRILFLC